VQTPAPVTQAVEPLVSSAFTGRKAAGAARKVPHG
jgi:hypothetical protein